MLIERLFFNFVMTIKKILFVSSVLITIAILIGSYLNIYHQTLLHGRSTSRGNQIYNYHGYNVTSRRMRLLDLESKVEAYLIQSGKVKYTRPSGDKGEVPKGANDKISCDGKCYESAILQYQMMEENFPTRFLFHMEHAFFIYVLSYCSIAIVFLVCGVEFSLRIVRGGNDIQYAVNFRQI